MNAIGEGVKLVLYFFSIVSAITLLSGEANADKKEAGKRDLDDLFQKYGKQYEVDPALIKAVASVESSLDPMAKNPSDPSYGLMQVMFPQQFNTNPPGWESIQEPSDLYDPKTNVKIGAWLLANNISKLGLKRGIGAYNHSENWDAPKGGPYPNPDYIRKVLNRRELYEGDFE